MLNSKKTHNYKTNKMRPALGRIFLVYLYITNIFAQTVVQKYKIWYNVDNDKFALVFLGAKYEN